MNNFIIGGVFNKSEGLTLSRGTPEPKDERLWSISEDQMKILVGLAKANPDDVMVVFTIVDEHAVVDQVFSKSEFKLSTEQQRKYLPTKGYYPNRLSDSYVRAIVEAWEKSSVSSTEVTHCG